MDLKFVSLENRERYFGRFYHRIRVLGSVQIFLAVLIFILTQVFSPFNERPIGPLVLLGLGVVLLIVRRGVVLEMLAVVDMYLVSLGLIAVTLFQSTVTGIQWVVFLLCPAIAMLVLPRLGVALTIVAVNFLALAVIPPLKILGYLNTSAVVNPSIVWLRWESSLIAFILLVTAILIIGYEERKSFRQVLRTLRLQSEASQSLTRTLSDVFASNQELEQQLAKQHELRSFIQDIGIPIITIREQFALLTLNGPLDIDWLRSLNTELPKLVYKRKYRGMVIDLTAAVLLDIESVHSLHQLVQKIELLGCPVNITGLSRKLARLLSRTDNDLLTERVIRLDTMLKRWFEIQKA